MASFDEGNDDLEEKFVVEGPGRSRKPTFVLHDASLYVHSVVIRICNVSVGRNDLGALSGKLEAIVLRLVVQRKAPFWRRADEAMVGPPAALPSAHKCPFRQRVLVLLGVRKQKGLRRAAPCDHIGGLSNYAGVISVTRDTGRPSSNRLRKDLEQVCSAASVVFQVLVWSWSLPISCGFESLQKDIWRCSLSFSTTTHRPLLQRAAYRPDRSQH